MPVCFRRIELLILADFTPEYGNYCGECSSYENRSLHRIVIMTKLKASDFDQSDKSDKATQWMSENIGMVFFFINRVLNYHFRSHRHNKPAAEDMLGVAYIAAKKAFVFYDPTRNVEFHTYFGRVFYNEFRREIMNDSQALHNVEYNLRYFHRRRAKDKTAQYIPVLSTVSDRLLYGFDEMHIYRDTAKKEYEFEEAALALYDNDRNKLFDMMTAELDQRSRQIIRMRFEEGKTLREIGETLDITKERVRQLEEKALNLMGNRTILLEKLLDLFGLRHLSVA